MSFGKFSLTTSILISFSYLIYYFFYLVVKFGLKNLLAGYFLIGFGFFTGSFLIGISRASSSNFLAKSKASYLAFSLSKASYLAFSFFNLFLLSNNFFCK